MCPHQKDDFIPNSLTLKDFQYRLPCVVRPQEDELMTSWIYRLSHKHLVKVFTFCKETLHTPQLWNRDIDKSISPLLLRELSKRTGVPLRRVFATTLRAYRGGLFEHCNSYSGSDWILPLGIYHRKRTRNGMLACPSCLSNDHHAYYRKSWRIASSFCCQICENMLIECCPNCQSCINFQRNDLGHKNDLSINQISCCSTCGLDLRTVVTTKTNNTELTLQKALNNGIDKNIIRSRNSVEYFSVLRMITRVLISNQKDAKNIRRVVNQYRDISFNKQFNTMTFEHLDLNSRKKLLIAAWWMMDKWPNRFLSIHRKAKTMSYVWCSKKNQLPQWFNEVIKKNLYRPGIQLFK